MTDLIEPLPYPGNPLEWGFDECSNMSLGLAPRPEALRPCDGPFPCGELDYEPRFPELVSVHPVRGIDQVSNGNPTRPNREVCKHHFGVALGMRPDGLLQPIVCVIPNVLDTVKQPLTNVRTLPRKYVSLGGVFVAQANDPTHSLKAGMMYFVAGVPDPPWMEGLFEHEKLFCAIQV